LKALKTYNKKQELEKMFTQWINEDEQRKISYGSALNLIRDAVADRKPYQHALQYIIECLFNSTEIIGFAGRAMELYSVLITDQENKEKTDSIVAVLTTLGDEFYDEYNPPTDKKVTSAMLKLFIDNVPVSNQPDFFRIIQSKYKGSVDRYVEKLFDRSVFTSREKFNAFLQHPSRKILEKDMAFVAALTTQSKFRDLYLQRAHINLNYDKGMRLFMAGLMEMQDDKVFYPDANSTMRLTYGTVQDYFPRDAVQYDYTTTLRGVMQKEDSSSREFFVPEKLKALFASKDYSPYGEKGIMPVCFITNNDITGGNSGSPVLNAEGNLIGLAFDGNWEAMTGNIIFEPDLQRCICVDIRYVLFIIDKYAGASHLVEEMKIMQ
ncbi:MAG: S46 family peptidase, partial [Bacteroidales bacterium]|nr:S46 family peptidase [Bacteroidales bacterium]